MDKLSYCASRLAVGNLKSHEIWDVVDHLSRDGVISDEFISILGSDRLSGNDFLAPFLTYLQSVNVVVPSKEIATWRIIYHHLEAILEGNVSPRIGLNQLMSDIGYLFDFQSVDTRIVGDSHGMESLVGLYWEMKDLFSKRSENFSDGDVGIGLVLEIDKEIVKRSRIWITKYFPICKSYLND